MSWKKEVLDDLHSNLSPSDFEKLIYVLLEKMGFSELELTGKSGDSGIDLTATWTQSQVPGLEIDLNFIIQVKRYSPNTILSPRFLRELRGTMKNGEWGLLVTTGSISTKTREEGLSDLSRIISVIDGSKLVDLCAEYEVGVKREFHFDSSFIEPEREVEEPELSPPPTAYPRDLSAILTKVVGEEFTKIGRTPLYRSNSKLVIARWSQRYARESQDFWYGLKARDFDLISSYKVTHFAYVCADEGVVLFPMNLVLKHIGSESLLKSPKEGPLFHYHIVFREENNELLWVLKSGITENVEKFYIRA